jgi:hypothetical protein
MLSDRVNWPQLPFPREGARQPMYAPPANSRVPQQMAYPPHATGGPPSKRARHAAANQNQQPPQVGGAIGPQIDNTFDDEEDISRGDMFDNLTPREVALNRYQQNHEWMEEILSSPYRIGQIAPADLNLGFKGILAGLTDGVFPAQGFEVLTGSPKDPYIGKLDSAVAGAFKDRAQAHIDSTKAEIDQLTAEYEKTIATFKANGMITAAEKEVRSLMQDGLSEPFQTDGALDDEDSGNRWYQRNSKKLEEAISRVETHVGQPVRVLHKVKRVQDGGYQEPAPEPIPEPIVEAPQETTIGGAKGASMSRDPSHAGSQNSGIMIGDSDIDMGGTAAGLLDQIHTGFSSTSTPINNFPTPQPQLSAIPSSAATPANVNIPSPVPVTAQPTIPEDVAMENADAAKDAARTTPDHGTGSGDWVVVPKGGASPDASGATPADGSTGEAAKAASAIPKNPSAAATPAVTEGGSVAFDANDNDFSSLGDLDTAGDALASYDAPAGELGDGLDLNMDMEISAFGDALHGVESTGTPAEGQPEGL